MSARILGQKNRKRIRYSVLYSPVYPAAGEACTRENIIRRREIGTTIRHIWLVVVTTFSKKQDVLQPCLVEMMIKYSSRRVVYEANDAKVVMFPYQMYKLISNKMNSV